MAYFYSESNKIVIRNYVWTVTRKLQVKKESVVAIFSDVDVCRHVVERQSSNKVAFHINRGMYI